MCSRCFFGEFFSFVICFTPRHTHISAFRNVFLTCLLLFSFQIASLRYKKQLFSLNLDGNPICDKLTDNIDFRLYVAAYLPKLKYYGYQVITNAERDEGREIYKYVVRLSLSFVCVRFHFVFVFALCTFSCFVSFTTVHLVLFDIRF